MPSFLRKRWWLRWLLPMAGLLGLVWFLVRVIPKPSRATYPCQRVAFPLASGFVVWLTGAIASLVAFRRAKRCFTRSRYAIGALCVVVSVGAAFFAMSGGLEKVAIGSDPNPNEPIGTARGINPGRVVWVHDANATDWAGSGDGYWYDNSATDPAVCEGMLKLALQELTGEGNDTAAWDAMFRHFNQSEGKGNVGYQADEKIMIKLNFVIFHRGDNIDGSGELSGGFDQCFNAPQMVLALIRRLVDEAQVDPCDITVGSTIDGFPNQFYNPIQDEFPGVVCIDYHGTLPGRTKPTRSTTDFIYWSDPYSSYAEGVPTCYADAEYLINFALLKGHPSAGITVCAKNHFGSFLRTPMDWWGDWGDEDYLNLHNFLPDAVPGMGHYRPFVDLTGSEHFDGKCVLWLIDGLYGCYRHQGNVEKWQMSPFNDDWPSSLFASQDPVAIDSVAYDFLWTEFNDVGTDHGLPHMDGAEDYLHEAAEANDPCSGVFYDPDADGNGLTSLGVHEHWNNAVDKQYSRNLGPDSGIELVAIVHSLGYKDDLADSDIAVTGTVSGSYIDTQNSDGSQAIEEIESLGTQGTRYSYLEHKWRIDITGNDKVTFHLQAYHTANAEGDDFVFAYSTDDSNYTDMLTVTKTGDDDSYQSYEMPNDISGTVYIRVRDADRTVDNTMLDTIYIDHMYIRSEPAGPDADFNGDDKVNFLDYAELADAWQSSIGEPDFNGIFDLHADETIDMLDLGIFAEKWLWQVEP